MTLPFLALHGPMVWKLILVAFVAGMFGLVQAIPRIRARRWARAATRSLDASTNEGIVRGTLGGGGAATLVAQRGTEEVVLQWDDGLWIETPEGRVELVGAVRVIAGSRVSAARNGVPRHAPTFAAPWAHAPRRRKRELLSSTVLQVCAGDEVIAHGGLVQAPSTDPSLYRDGAAVLSLHAGTEPIALAARVPRSAVPRGTLLGAVAWLGLFAFVGYKIEDVVGSELRDRCFRWGETRGYDSPPLAELELTNRNTCVLANAMPGQDLVLDHVLDVYDQRAPHDEPHQQTRLELARVVAGCEGALSRLERMEQPELLLDEARRCHELRRQQLALLALGHVDEAGALPVLNELAPQISILSGHWQAAADVAARTAAHAAGLPHDPDDADDARNHATARYWSCVAELMRWYGGDRAALDRARAIDPDRRTCAPMLAEMDPEIRRFDTADLAGTEVLRAQLLHDRLAGAPRLGTDHLAELLAAGESGAGAMSLLDTYATAVTPEPPPSASPAVRFDDASQRAALAVITGDIPAAHRLVDRALAASAELPSDQRPFAMHFAPMFHALVDLYTPTLDTPYVVDARVAPIAAFFTASLAIRRGLPPPPNGRPFESTLFTALESAEGGDDRRLLEALARPYASWQPMDLVAVLPRIRPPHAALVRELRWGRGQMDLSVKFPSTTLLHAVARRTIFELAGDHDEAERWAAIARRFDHALRDRRVLVALTLFD